MPSDLEKVNDESKSDVGVARADMSRTPFRGIPMARKPIPETTQTSILLKSRRRCCLCFWLKGEDEVKKGQLAHLDGDNENFAEDNLAFLCLEHHDEYDSIPRISKGLREQEVRRWRRAYALCVES